MREMSLVLFTVLSQAAVGLVLVTAALSLMIGERSVGLQAALRDAGRIALPLALLGLLASFAHLGSPMGAFRALTNLGTSWLSREILLMAVFAAGAGLYAYLWHLKPQAQGALQMTGLVTALLGLAAVYATGMVYQLATRPDWNHWSNLAAGFVTTLLIGSLAVALLAAMKGGQDAQRYLGYTLLAGVALLLVSLIFYAPYLSQVSGATALLLFTSPWFWVRVAVGIGLPVIAAALLVRGQQPGVTVLGVALVALVTGELIGRSLFYESVLSQLPLF